MQTVYKCKNCEYGPCYCSTVHHEEMPFGEDCDAPFTCPYFGHGETPEWEMCAPEITPNSPKWLDGMQEWMQGEGYDKAPEKLRDAIMACSMAPAPFYASDLMRVFNFLREVEESTYSSFMDREEMEKQLKKITKRELIAAIFPEAFKAGVAYAEYVRQEQHREPTFPTL